MPIIIWGDAIPNGEQISIRGLCENTNELWKKLNPEWIEQVDKKSPWILQQQTKQKNCPRQNLYYLLANSDGQYLSTFVAFVKDGKKLKSLGKPISLTHRFWRHLQIHIHNLFRQNPFLLAYTFLHLYTTRKGWVTFLSDWRPHVLIKPAATLFGIKAVSMHENSFTRR